MYRRRRRRLPRYGSFSSSRTASSAAMPLAPQITRRTALMTTLAATIPWPVLAGAPSRKTPTSTMLGLVILPGVGFALSGITFGSVTAFLTLYFSGRLWECGALAFTAFATALIGVRIAGGHLPSRYSGDIGRSVTMIRSYSAWSRQVPTCLQFQWPSARRGTGPYRATEGTSARMWRWRRW